MKNTIVLSMILLIGLSAFANNSDLRLNNPEKIKHQFEQNENDSTKFAKDMGFGAICSVTIVNTDTGETRTVSATGSGSTPTQARDNCVSNARATAAMLVAILNG